MTLNLASVNFTVCKSTEVSTENFLVPSILSRRGFLLSGGVFIMTGCAVPRGAPSRSEVLSGAHSEGVDDDQSFALELVRRDRLALYKEWSQFGRHGNTDWLPGNVTPIEQRLAPGDRLIVRIWDANASSLIASPGAQFSDIQNVAVGSSGHVNLPYIEQVEVAGLSYDAARLRLQERLAAIAPAAQVQIAVEQGRRNSVDVLGGVAKPGSYPLTERNLPLSNIISMSGGVLVGLENPQVQITRGRRVYRRSMQDIMSDPSKDPALQGGDRILIEADQRTFTALGAAGREEVISFDSDKVSALRAVSMMGGLADNRADPRGILVLRRYPNSAVGHPNGPPNTHVVFSFDMTRADGLFEADEFALQNGDIVMATQSPGTTTQRVIALFGSVIGVGRSVGNL